MGIYVVGEDIILDEYGGRVGIVRREFVEAEGVCLKSGVSAKPAALSPD